MLPDWLSQAGIATVCIVCFSVVSYKGIELFINKQLQRDSQDPNLSSFINENTKVTTELITLLKEQQREHRESIEKQNEIMNGLVLATHELVLLSKTMLNKLERMGEK